LALIEFHVALFNGGQPVSAAAADVAAADVAAAPLQLGLTTATVFCSPANAPFFAVAVAFAVAPLWTRLYRAAPFYGREKSHGGSQIDSIPGGGGHLYI